MWPHCYYLLLAYYCCYYYYTLGAHTAHILYAHHTRCSFCSFIYRFYLPSVAIPSSTTHNNRIFTWLFSALKQFNMITRKHGTWHIRLRFALPIKLLPNGQSTLNDSDRNLVSFNGFAYRYIWMKRQTNGNLITAYNVRENILTRSTPVVLVTNLTRRWRFSFWLSVKCVRVLKNPYEFYNVWNFAMFEFFQIKLIKFSPGWFNSFKIRFKSNRLEENIGINGTKYE